MDINEFKGLLGVSEDDKKGALNMGLLQAGLGILANNTSRNAGPALAKGGMMGLQGYQQSLDTAQKEKMQKLQMAELVRKLTQEDRQRKILSGLGSFVKSPAQQALASGEGPTNENAAEMANLSPQIDLSGMYGALASSGDPSLAMKGIAGIAEMQEKNLPKYVTLNNEILQTTPSGIKSVYTGKPKNDWSEPYQLGGATVQRNNNTGEIKTAVTRPPQINVGGGESLMTDDTLQMDAWRYLTDGTLPPNMGRGMQGAQQAAKIRNKSSELAKDMGMSPDEIRFAQLENKAQVGAIAQLARAKAQILQFEKTASNNADLALEQSRKVWRTGSPMINKPLQWLQSEAAGDPGVKVFNAANETFVSEYARVMSGGYGAAQTTEGAQQRAHKLLSTASTSDQYEKVVSQLKREMGNRVKALNDQMTEEKSNLRAGVSPRAAPSATPSAATSGKTATLADIQATASATGKSTAQITADLKAKGYKIGGE